MRRPHLSHWRLIISPPLSGPWNMALDEAILESTAALLCPPTLRLYDWSPPCLSLGYSQPIAQIDLPCLKASGWDIVRRPTGGRAILHIDELTYSIALPENDPHVQGGVLDSYRHLSKGLVSTLDLLGVEVEIQPVLQRSQEKQENPICFELPSSYEITTDGKKLLGSAQVRRKGGVLQHGSLPLQGDITRIVLVLSITEQVQRQKSIENVRERATTVEEILGKRIPWEEAAVAMQRGFTQALGIHLERGELTNKELTRAATLCKERYKQKDWTERI